jgi:hypothetical protein
MDYVGLADMLHRRDSDAHRMGAALTYALFTLVGIAGEDDLDAPDLITARAETGRRKNERPPERRLELPQPTSAR